jgi:sulfur-oxidizing protein SoxB
MVRVGGMGTGASRRRKSVRISNILLGGKPIDAGKTYKVASWAPVAEGATGEPVWEIVTNYLRDRKVIRPPTLNHPQLIGVRGNPGIT